MAKKCELCKNEIETNYIGKLEGTVVKTGTGETSKIHYICKDCQKEHGEKLKEKLE